MTSILPNPTVPTNGQTLDATPLLANLVALAEAIESFDGSQIVAASVVAAAFNASINPNTILSETIAPFVASGCVWSTSATLSTSMTAGVIYINGFRVPVNAVAAHSFTASKDTYVDVDVNANLTYVESSNGGAAGALTANSIRIAKVITSGTAVTTVTQTGIDSLGHQIYQTSPAYNQKIFTATGTWTKPSGLKSIVVECIGGGGGGGGAASAALSFGDGGGAGGYSKKIVKVASLGTTETVTIGAAGTSGSGAAGGAGGTSSFGSHASCTGGGGGTASNNYSGQAGPSVAGGVGSSGDINAAGMPGMPATGLSTTRGYGGMGGSSIYGAGGGQSAGTGTAQTVAGNAATGYGAAGGGAAVTGSQAAKAGGAATAGIIIVHEYF